MDSVPDGIEKRNFVGEKFKDIERDSDAENDRVSDDCERRRQVNHAETLQQPEGSDGGVEVEA